jgi:hypothetical protein
MFWVTPCSAAIKYSLDLLVLISFWMDDISTVIISSTNEWVGHPYTFPDKSCWINGK